MTTEATGAQGNTDAATQQAAATTAGEGSQSAVTTDQGTSLLTDAGATGEAKPGDGNGEEGAKTEDKASDTPAEYTDFAAPDGIELDTDLLAEFKPMAKELGLSQENAQKLVDMGAKLIQKQQQAFADMVDGWATSAKTDKEFGGDKLQENLGVAKKALDAFGSPELLEALKTTGMGNHPELIRAFVKVGKAISEDGFVRGQAAAPKTAQTFYDASNMNP